jgi:O-antigen ligase
MYGRERSVHSSHFQVLAETGFAGIVVWVGLFATALCVALRVRRRASAAGLSAADTHFLLTASNALIASMCGFLVGGSFVALALNDLTWLTFALIAALDYLSIRIVAGGAAEVSGTARPGVH